MQYLQRASGCLVVVAQWQREHWWVRPGTLDSVTGDYLLLGFLYFCLITSNIFLAGPPSVPSLSCVDHSGDVNGAVNVTVSWTLSGGDSADFYLINISTNAPQTTYGGLLNITTGSVTQHELTGFMAGYEYNITVHGVSCGSLVGNESEPLTITPQGILIVGQWRSGF